MSKIHCPLPWSSVEVRTDGTYAPCCLSEENILENGEKIHATTHTITDALNTEYMQSLRQSFTDGVKDKRCNICWVEEAAGRQSKRISMLQKSGPKDVVGATYLDLKIGNTCNLRCRICGPSASSSWAQANFVMTGNPKEKEWINAGKWANEDGLFWEGLTEVLPQVEFMEITGGEPFLIRKHFEVLKHAIKMGVSKNIHIHYNTNGTIYPDEAMDEIWPHFKNVEIAFSIDDLDGRFEYQRHPAKWEMVAFNLSRFYEKKQTSPWMTTQICCSVSKFNILSLPEIDHWLRFQQADEPKLFDFIYFNLVHHPSMNSIKSFSPGAKSIIGQKLMVLEDSPNWFWYGPILEFMAAPYPKDEDQLFSDRVMLHDYNRNQRFEHVFPELAKIIDENSGQ